MGKYLSVLSEVSEKQPPIPYAREKKSGNTYSQEVPKVPKPPILGAVAVARGDGNVMAQRVAAQWNATFTPEEIEEYNRAVFALDHGLCPEDTQP